MNQKCWRAQKEGPSLIGGGEAIGTALANQGAVPFRIFHRPDDQAAVLFDVYSVAFVTSALQHG